MEMFKDEEIQLFRLIAESLVCSNKKKSASVKADFGKVLSRDAGLQGRVVELAAHQSVLPVIGALILEEEPEPPLRDMIHQTAMSVAMEFYQLLFIARNVIGVLSDGGVESVLLKGASVARFYPKEEMRKSSDVDVLLADPEQVGTAGRLLEQAGYRLMDHQTANHHQVWATPDNHLLELHMDLVEPFGNRKWNRYIGKLFKLDKEDICEISVLGSSLRVMREDLLAFHLLLHMLQDFMRSGFGLKQLCDWVVFWNRRVDREVAEGFLEYVRECGLEGFLSGVTTVCIRYLGLGRSEPEHTESGRSEPEHTESGRSEPEHTESGRLEQDYFGFVVRDGQVYLGGRFFCSMVSEELSGQLMKEIVDAEREGKPDSNRMVIMRGKGIWACFLEFHHQTMLYYPRAGKWIVTLPVLYVVVLVRFLKNNRKVRRTTSWEIFQTARERSRLADRLLNGR